MEQVPTAKDVEKDNNKRTGDAAPAEGEDKEQDLKMPRPRRCRRISIDAAATYFKPAGIPLIGLEEVTLEADEIQAIKHCDLDGTDQATAAEKMMISQPTVHRILQNARKKIADAIINGKAIRVKKRE